MNFFFTFGVVSVGFAGIAILRGYPATFIVVPGFVGIGLFVLGFMEKIAKDIDEAINEDDDW